MKTEIINFTATWCGPCKMMKPILDEIQGEYPDLVIHKTDIDVETDKVKEYNVQSVPTYVILKDGVEIDRVIGAKPKFAFLNRVFPEGNK